MPRPRFAARRLVVAGILVAAALAALGVRAGDILSVAVLVVAAGRFSTRWEAWEAASAAAWLALAAVASSEVSPSPVDLLLLAPGCLVLALSWVLRLVIPRTFRERKDQRFRITTVRVLCTPAALAAGIALLVTEPGFHLRFRLSEPELTSFARQFPAGARQSFGLTPRRLGSIRVLEVRDFGGWIHFTTSTFIRSSDGLVYIPPGAAPRRSDPDYRYWHVRGSWWRFWESH